MCGTARSSYRESKKTMKNFKVGDKVVRTSRRKSGGWFWAEQPMTIKFTSIYSDIRYLEFEEVHGMHCENYFSLWEPLTPQT